MRPFAYERPTDLDGVLPGSDARLRAPVAERADVEEDGSVGNVETELPLLIHLRRLQAADDLNRRRGDALVRCAIEHATIDGAVLRIGARQRERRYKKCKKKCKSPWHVSTS